MSTLIINIKQVVGVREDPYLLRGKELAGLPVINNAWLRVEGEQIAGYGPMEELKHGNDANIIDATSQYLLPCWCDSHTHLVFATSREYEFIDKIKGKTYAEIAANGGGILNSAKKIQEANEEDLFQLAMQRLNAIRKTGTGAVEIKSGYGLTPDAEIKILRVIQRLKKASNLIIKATFLGAHAFPVEFKENHQGYIEQIIHEMLPVIAQEKLADYIDVFCEEGFFSVKETAQILEAGKRLGLKPKIHANQLHNSGGVQVGIQHGAVSVDHLETIGEAELDALDGSNTIATLLPSAAFFLRMQYPPVREMLKKNIAVALATDYNPGSSPSGNVPLLIALSCIQMKMTPEEAINAATINGAYAMEVADETGSITVGKKANLIFTKPMPSLAYMPYSFGENVIDKVMIRGKFDDFVMR